MISPGENEPRAPINLENITLYYQPQVALRSNSIISLEVFPCLPAQNEAEPPQFIKYSHPHESQEFSLAVLKHTLSIALSQLRYWEENQIYYGMISLRLTGSSFREELIPVIEAALREYGLPGNRLELLIPVELIVGGRGRAHHMLQLLHGIDAVLTFVSKGEQNFAESLSALSSLPVQGLRTQSFRKEPRRKFDEMEILFTINRGHILEIPVTVDDVGTMEQLHFLYENGCDIIQGDIICRPQSADFIEELLQLASSDKIALV